MLDRLEIVASAACALLVLAVIALVLVSHLERMPS